MSDAVVSVERLSKTFAGEPALDDVSIEIGAREVVGVVGENGAGKSTLLKVLAGVCRPDSGRIVVRGKPMRLNSVRDAANAGIGMVFQEQSLLPNLRVAENILLGHEDAALRAGFYDWKRLYALATMQLAKLDSRIDPSAHTHSLSFAERQMVELAKAMAIEERTRHEPVILLDEPTSMLDAGQVETVLALIERLRRRACVVFVSHRLDEVLRVCDRIYVMVDGRCIAQRDRASCSGTDLQRLMLGRTLGTARARQSTQGPTNARAVSLSVRRLSRARSYHAVSFELHAGEVLGIAGAAGSGRESLCRTLFGAEAPDSGEILLDGQPVRFAEPADAVRLGIGYVPAERRVEGIVAGLSMSENMTLAHLDELRRGPVIDFGREGSLVRRWVEQLNIKPRTVRTPAQFLSGGNQQKLVLAKWLIARTPRILVLDHPLRGLDVGAKAEMSASIRRLASSGIGIVLIADTVEELIALSDSLIVMKDGAVAGTFPAGAAQPSEQRILEHML